MDANSGLSPAKRKWVLYCFLLIVAGLLGWFPAQPRAGAGQNVASQRGGFLRHPIWVYNNWSAYDELSDRIPLTEKLAMRELDEIVRLKKSRVHFDYYMMDAFWYDPDGAYRSWRKADWPQGPDRWIAACKAQGLKPGLWIATNALPKINPAPAWRDSLNAKRDAMSLSEGGFLPDLMEALQYWYDRGIRAFKFDFANFRTATPAQGKSLTPEQVEERNRDAFRAALGKFRAKNPDVLLVAFNGFGGDYEYTSGHYPFQHPVDLRWLDVFDTLYCGDPRPSDVPQANFWRSVDIYSDHMVRRYEQNAVPLERIDSTSVMFGTAGTIYYRRKNAWKGELLLEVSRGGWNNTVHGNLELLDSSDAKWFAKVQEIFRPLQADGVTKTFGGIPGDVQPYGFASLGEAGSIYVVVNPAQAVETLELPSLSQSATPRGHGRIIFRDAGFEPVFDGNKITLGPGQMAAVGFRAYASPEYDLGVQEDVVIPRRIESLRAKFQAAGENIIEASLPPPAQGNLRIIFQQRGADGQVLRSWPGAPPNGISMGKVLQISATQAGKSLPVDINYDKQIWSGLSWGAGEIKRTEIKSKGPILIRCSSAEKSKVALEGHVYEVQY